MIVDFQQHYTPPEFLKGDPKTATVQLDERGNPNYFPDRWNMAGPPTPVLENAWTGRLVEQENDRCEQIMARKLGR